MSKSILLTNGGGCFGLATALALGNAGHTVFVGLQGADDPAAHIMRAVLRDDKIDLRPIELDMLSQTSVDAAVEAITREAGLLDVLVHNSGYLVSGRADNFTAEQLIHLYDMNVRSTQSVHRAVIPQFRRQGDGLIICVSNLSSAGSIPPYLAPYFSKVSTDSVARIYTHELAEAGIDCCTILPRRRHGTYHDTPRVDPTSVASVVLTIVDLPRRERPLRIFVHCRDAGNGPQLTARRLSHRVAPAVPTSVPAPNAALGKLPAAADPEPERTVGFSAVSAQSQDHAAGETI